MCDYCGGNPIPRDGRPDAVYCWKCNPRPLNLYHAPNKRALTNDQRKELEILRRNLFADEQSLKRWNRQLDKALNEYPVSVHEAFERLKNRITEQQRRITQLEEEYGE